MFLITLAIFCLLAPSALNARRYGGAGSGGPGLGGPVQTPGLRVKFSESSEGVGTDSFISLPLNSKAAASSGWTQVSRPKGPEEYSSLVLWCPKDDYSICVLYDDTEYVAGLQIGLDEETLTDLEFDMPTIGFTKWATKVNGSPKSYWTVQQYYLSGAKLATAKSARLASRDPTKLIQDTDIYVSGLNGGIQKISTDPKELDKSIFKKQNCVNKMGTHYYYNMTSNFVCEAGNMFPFFPLVSEGKLIGVGLLTYGRRTLKPGQKDWLETFKQITIQTVLREKVPCMLDLSKKDVMLTLHTYFVDKPYDIKC